MEFRRRNDSGASQSEHHRPAFWARIHATQTLDVFSICLTSINARPCPVKADRVKALANDGIFRALDHENQCNSTMRLS